MKKIITFILIALTLSSQGAATLDVVGKFIKADKKLNLPYDYYLFFENSKGEKHAVPIDKESVKMVKGKPLEQTYFVKVDATEKDISVGESGQKQKVIVFHIKDLKGFKLSDLDASKDMKLPAQPSPRKQGEPPVRPGMRINDKLANTIIATAGAALLYSIIAN